MEREKTPVAKAVRELRQVLGETQQDFAYRMNTAIRTIARWETIRPPKAADTLNALADLAAKHDRYDLVNTFLPSSPASIIANVLMQSGSPGLFSDPPHGPALLRSLGLVWLAGVLGNPAWDKAIRDAVRMLDGPRRPEVGKAFDMFAAQIDGIQRDLRAGSISAENTQDPSEVKPPEGVK